MKMAAAGARCLLCVGLLGWLSAVLATSSAPALSTSPAPECACLSQGGEPGPGDCPCDVGLCYSRCVGEHPHCTLQCSSRCSCYRGNTSHCPTHEDPGPTPTLGPTFCAGDCTDDGSVTIDEIVTAVDIGLESVDACLCVTADIDRDGRVTIDEILTAVNNALDGCGTSIPSPTATPLQPTASPTASAAPTARSTVLGIGDLGSAEITVRVADAASHDPIKGATVSFQRLTLIGNSPGPFAGSGITDSQGSIQFLLFIHDTDMTRTASLLRRKPRGSSRARSSSEKDPDSEEWSCGSPTGWWPLSWCLTEPVQPRQPSAARLTASV